jgi:putative membrane protein
MTVVTIYFALLPILIAIAVNFARKKDLEKHYKMQVAVFVLTLVMVGIFEIGVRLSGGFESFMKTSNADYTYMLILLIVHIIIAVVSFVGYAILIYSAVKEYKLGKEPIVKSHKKFGILVTIGLAITSFLGVCIYYFLFIY